MIRGADPEDEGPASRPSLSLRIPRGSAPLHAFSCGLGRMTKLRPDLPLVPPTPACPPAPTPSLARLEPTTPGGAVVTNPFAPGYGGTGGSECARSRAMSAPASMHDATDDSMAETDESSASSGGSRSSMDSVEETEGETSSAESGGSSRSLEARGGSGANLAALAAGRPRADSRAKKKCLRVSFCAEVAVIACSAPASTPTWDHHHAGGAGAGDGGMDSVSTRARAEADACAGAGAGAGAAGLSVSMGGFEGADMGMGMGGVAFFERRSVSCDSGLTLPEHMRGEAYVHWAARPPPPPMPVPSSGSGAGGVITGVMVDGDDGEDSVGGVPPSPPSPLKRKRMLGLPGAGGLEDSCDADIEDSTESHGGFFEMGSSYEGSLTGMAGGQGQGGRE